MGTMQLADLGAEVIKLEDPAHGGDVGRYVPPFQADEDSLFFESFNRGKRSISLDLRTDAGRRVFADLVPHVDALYCNLRGDQPAKLGLTYDALRHLNPAIVCCSLSGFGRTGPRAAEGAYDPVLQALAGWMSVTGDPAGPPTKSGLSLVDFCGGYVSGLALLGGLWRARRDGVGCDCDTSLFETALALLTYVGTWSATEGHEPRRMPESAHPSIAPFQALETADGWMTVACAKEKFWLVLCEALEREDLAADPRFADFGTRFEHRDELLAILRPLFRAQPTDALVTRLTAAGVPCAPVNDVAAALADPQVTARDGLLAYEHPHFGTIEQPATALRLDDPAPPAGRAPRRGEHTDATLARLCGYDAEHLARLRAEGAFGA